MDLSKMSSSNSPNNIGMPTSLPIRYTGSSSHPAAAMALMEYHHQQVQAQQRLLAAELARARNFALSANSNSTGTTLGLPLPFGPFSYGNTGGFGPFANAGYSPRNMFNRFMMREELPKPTHSYIGLIGMAILSSPEKKMILSDIYAWILDHYAYFRTRAPGWKNSIRHNLSLNACFVKCGRSATGKGHYWAINPANLKDFQRGDFRRRKAQQKAHRMMGIQGNPTDDEDDSPCPSLTDEKPRDSDNFIDCSPSVSPAASEVPKPVPTKKRKGFDMESLLAPESQKCKVSNFPCSQGIGEEDRNKQCVSDSSPRRSHFNPPLVKFEEFSSSKYLTTCEQLNQSTAAKESRSSANISNNMWNKSLHGITEYG